MTKSLHAKTSLNMKRKQRTFNSKQSREDAVKLLQLEKDGKRLYSLRQVAKIVKISKTMVHLLNQAIIFNQTDEFNRLMNPSSRGRQCV